MAKKTTTDETQPEKVRSQSPAPEAAPTSVSEKAGQLKDFFEESKAELKKVTWPTQKEVKATAIAVLILVVVMSLFLGVVDALLSKLVQYFLT